MSQFVLFSGPPMIVDVRGIRVVSVIADPNELPMRVASAMCELGPLDRIWSFEDEAFKSSDHVFVEAQIDIAEGKHLSETRLGRVLFEILKEADHIVLWYSDDWMNLTRTNEPSEFLCIVERALMTGSGEIYLHYARN